MALKDTIAGVVARVQALKPVRVFVRYGQDRGPILASGMAYTALFAVFAGLWVGFSIAGLVISGDTALQDAIFDALAQAVPGLIDDGSNNGAIDPKDLTSGFAFSVSGIAAIVGLLFTALGWLGAARDSVRTLFDLPPVAANPVLQKLTDLALGIGFAALLLLAAGLSFAGTSLTRLVFDALGVDDDSIPGIILSRTVTLIIAVLVYALALAGLYRLLARVRIPWRLLRGGVLIGAVGLAALTIAGGLLLGGASNNPLIASFAVVAGLLIYYNFVSQVILLAASWMAVGADDEGLVLDQKVFDARLERARELVKAHEPEPEPAEPGFWGRLFGRRDGGRR
jgi:membrane protein